MNFSNLGRIFHFMVKIGIVKNILLIFKFFLLCLCTGASVWVCACVCRCLQGPEASDSSGITDSSEAASALVPRNE